MLRTAAQNEFLQVVAESEAGRRCEPFQQTSGTGGNRCAPLWTLLQFLNRSFSGKRENEESNRCSGGLGRPSSTRGHIGAAVASNSLGALRVGRVYCGSCRPREPTGAQQYGRNNDAWNRLCADRVYRRQSVGNFVDRLSHHFCKWKHHPYL